MKDILELDVGNYATAVGHAAAVRLAQVLGPDADPNFWFCDGGFQYEIEGEAEAKVNALGAYVADRGARGAEVFAEQLFIKAGELGAHRFPANRFADLDLWVRVAYGAFAAVAGLCARDLGKAQAEARAVEARLRAANEDFDVVPPLATDQTQLPATADTVTGDDAGTGSSPDAEPVPPVAEGEALPSATPEVVATAAEFEAAGMPALAALAAAAGEAALSAKPDGVETLAAMDAQMVKPAGSELPKSKKR